MAARDEPLVLTHQGVSFDAREYSRTHPGGPDVLEALAGKSIDEAFEDIGHSKRARELLERLKLSGAHGEPARTVVWRLFTDEDRYMLHKLIAVVNLALLLRAVVLIVVDSRHSLFEDAGVTPRRR